MLAFIVIAALAVMWFAWDRRRAEHSQDRVALPVRTDARPPHQRHRRR